MIWIPIQFTIPLQSPRNGKNQFSELLAKIFSFQNVTFNLSRTHQKIGSSTSKSSRMFQNIFQAFQNILNCSMIFQVVFHRYRILQNALETSNNNRELCIDSQQRTSVSSAIRIGDKGQGHIIITANLTRGSNQKNSSNLLLLKCLFVDHLQHRIGINFYSLLSVRLHLFRLLVDTKITWANY